jgi:hypothetical protein
MKRTSTLRSVVALFVAALLIGCAEVPQEQIEKAQAALAAAIKADAERYAPAELMAAQDSLRAAMAEIDRQKSSFALVRRYDDVVQKLQSATIAANHAFDRAKAIKDTAYSETLDFLKQARAAVDSGQALLQQTPKGKDDLVALEAIQTDLTAVEADIAKADSLLSTGDLLMAREKAKACLAEVNAIREKLKDAIEKKKARPAAKGRKKT